MPIRSEKDSWTNVVRYADDAYLSKPEAAALKSELRRCWHVLGMLHLRLHNDIDTNAAKTMPKPEIREKIDDLLQRIRKLENDYLDK